MEEVLEEETPLASVKEEGEKKSLDSNELEAKFKEAYSKYIHQVDPVTWVIDKGFVPNMRVPAKFYVNELLRESVFEELLQPESFVPALKQISNVASLPGIVGHSIGLPDIHAGYGFAIGNVAAMDMNDPNAVVSPGGVGFDISCGVRLIRTNLTREDVEPVREQLAQLLFQYIPVGVGAQSLIQVDLNDMDKILEKGLEWALDEGYAWPEDLEHCVAAGTLVSLSNGVSMPIEQLPHQGGASVLSLSNALAGLVPTAVQERVFNNGVRECVRVLLHDASSVTCTGTHRFRTVDGRWVAASALTGTDEVVLGLQYPSAAVPSNGDPEAAREATWQCTFGSVTFSCATPAEREKSMAFCRLLGYTLTDGSFNAKGETKIYAGHELDACSLQNDVVLCGAPQPYTFFDRNVYVLNLGMQNNPLSNAL